MSQISSINFKKSNAIQATHNDRTLAPSYLISDSGCECNRNAEQAKKLKKQIIENAKEAYATSCKARNKAFQAKSYEWSAVCNIKPDTNMQDLERLAKHFETKYRFQCYQIAIHRDEGYIDDKGEKHINHHPHLEFITLDKETGKNCFKLRDFPKSKMREIQDEVAKILCMERGQDKRISNRERVEPRKYAQMKEQERKEQAKLKAEHKQELEAKDNVIQSQDQAIQDLKDENTELKAKNKLILTQEQIQEIINQALAQKKAEIEQIKQEAKKRESKIIENFYDEIDKMEAEIKEKDKVIKSQNAEIQAKNQELEQEKLSKAELKKELEQLRKNSKNQGFSKEFFQEINLEKKRLRFDNKKEIEQWFQNLVEEHTKKGFLGNKVDNDGIFEEMYKVYKKPYEKIEEKDQEIATLKAELKRSEAKNNEAKNKIQWLENKEKAEKFFDKNTDKIEQNQENDYDDYEHSEQDQEEDQTHNENDDLGIHKILRPRKNK